MSKYFGHSPLHYNVIALHPFSCKTFHASILAFYHLYQYCQSTIFLLYFIFIFFPEWELAEQLKHGEHNSDILSVPQCFISSTYSHNKPYTSRAVSVGMLWVFQLSGHMHHHSTLRTVKETWSEHTGKKISLSNSKYVLYTEDATSFCAHF